ncbi:helix-turn-helix transcriptional regulator [Micromonospora sp. STR1s_5]|nr:helix-turn-helix transcriptional regulator [Micromonospora sp. STR1s_5]
MGQGGYDQFCAIAKAAEVVAARWTPLILRELMTGVHGFSDIQRGIPLISRAVLVSRLRELETEDIIERRPRPDGKGHEYWLTPAGEALRGVVAELGYWGLVHARGRIKPTDLDPGLLVWGFRKRARLDCLPERRILVRFEFSGVPASRTRYRVLWLVLQRSGAEVCAKDPGFETDLIIRGAVADFVALYLGHARWKDLEQTAITIDGDPALAREVPAWIRLDQAVGRDFPPVPRAPSPPP